jgi:predicted RNA-binding protein with PIN domain
MPILIDGHNLIGKMSSISLADPEDEDKLVRILARRLHLQRQKLIVVFDKGADIEFSVQRKSSGLRVIFAPPGSCADAIIMEMIRRDPNPKGLTVVSSDNEIRRCARSRKARVISSEEFARTIESPPRRSKRGGGEDDMTEHVNVKEWLEYFRTGRT